MLYGLFMMQRALQYQIGSKREYGKHHLFKDLLGLIVEER
jgi:hypothetical protein